MASHDHDDFSFLPTVDSADEEGVIKEQLWPAPPPPHQEEVEENYDGEEHLHEEHPHEEPCEELPQNEEAPYQEPPAMDAPHLAVPPPAPVKKGRVFEPDVADHGHLGAAEQPPEAPPPAIAPVIPRPAEPRQTPAVAFGRHAMEQEFAPAAPAPLANTSAFPAQPPPIPLGSAPLLETEAPAIHTGLAADPEVAPADNSAELKQSKKRALLMTLGVHVAVILVLLLMHVPMLDFTPPEIVATTEVENLENESWKKVTTAAPQTSPMAASISPLLSTGVSDIAMPEIDFSATSSDLNLGTSFGSFGSGVTTGGAGGKVSFLGNSATARHIVFVVDVSFSMSAPMNVGEAGIKTRFDLLKSELIKSVSRLPAGAGYQILFFADFAWPHDAVDSNDESALLKYAWTITAEDKTPKIPRFNYLAATSANIARTKKIVAEANNPGFTNWGSGLMMALKANPKPDVIFFMTDGERKDEQGWIEAVTVENRKRKPCIIHTTALGNTEAARELDEMARRNGGKFTAVMADGRILQMKDLVR